MVKSTLATLYWDLLRRNARDKRTSDHYRCTTAFKLYYLPTKHVCSGSGITDGKIHPIEICWFRRDAFSWAALNLRNNSERMSAFLHYWFYRRICRRSEKQIVGFPFTILNCTATDIEKQFKFWCFGTFWRNNLGTTDRLKRKIPKDSEASF